MAKKKTTTRKTTTKKKTTRASSTAETKPRTKAQIFGELAESTGLSRREIAGVFDTMAGLMKKDLGRRGPGIFNVAGLMKVKVVHKPATKARKGISPFTGEEIVFKAKPARRVVKVQALKGLKDMV